MNKDKLIAELVAVLNMAGEALAFAEIETKDQRKRAMYSRAIERASEVILKARKHG